MRQLLFSLLCLGLVSCGSKDEVKVAGSVPAVVPGPRPQQPVAPVPREREREDVRTQVQIACESDAPMGIFLPNSQQATGHRVRDYISSESLIDMTSPAVLGMQSGRMKLFFFREGEALLTDFDFPTHKEVGERSRIAAKLPGTSAVYSWLGFKRPRSAAASPDRKAFALATEGGFTVRSFAAPSEILARWKLSKSYANPRWEPVGRDESEVFLDRLDGAQMRQTWMRIGSGNRRIADQVAPPPVFGGHQIGLRRLDTETLLWLEWTKDRALVRLWNTVRDRVENLAVPPSGSGFGPGLALFRDRSGEKLVVLQSQEALHFFRIAAGALLPAYDLEYPRLVQDYIQRGWLDWKPGAVYSSANDTQLFTVLPFTWGKLLFSVEDGNFFKQLGHFSCVNPDFYPEIY